MTFGTLKPKALHRNIAHLSSFTEGGKEPHWDGTSVPENPQTHKQHSLSGLTEPKRLPGVPRGCSHRGAPTTTPPAHQHTPYPGSCGHREPA